MLVTNAWYVAAWADELSMNPLARRICNEPVVLYRTFEGTAAALRDSCCHRGAPLSLGAVVERGLRCNYHGLVFGADGACVHIPGQEVIPKKARVRSYPVVEKDQLIWIWMGEREEADPSEIVDYPYHNDTANWPSHHDVMPVYANYLLLVDNLMDATHLAYVHPSSVGGAAPGVHFKAEMVVKPTDRGIRIDRRMPNSPPPPTYNNCVAFPGNVDRWQEFEFVAPSTVLQYSGAVEAGAGRDNKSCVRFDMRLFHALTPETQTTSFYFWSAANGHRANDPSATKKIVKEITIAFREDKAMVEAQQARLSELGEEWLVDNRSDAPRLAMRRAVASMVKRPVADPAIQRPNTCLDQALPAPDRTTSPLP
jgi:phenylpropionate dioxygenase-like ring-hydroxylating dioxygenase large terminal subunit